MKKIIFILIAVFALTACKETKAQITMYKSTSVITGITTQVADTITNTGTTYFSTRTGALNSFSNGNYRASFTIDTTSGTPATVYCIQQGSMDGITWFDLNSNALGTDGYNCDSLSIAGSSLTNITQTLSTVKGSTKFVYGATRGSGASRVLYYRLKFVGSGTQTVRVYNVKLYPF